MVGNIKKSLLRIIFLCYSKVNILLPSAIPWSTLLFSIPRTSSLKKKKKKFLPLKNDAKSSFFYQLFGRQLHSPDIKVWNIKIHKNLLCVVRIFTNNRRALKNLLKKCGKGFHYILLEQKENELNKSNSLFIG